MPYKDLLKYCSLAVCFLGLLTLSCKDSSKASDEIAKIELRLEIKRFDRDFAQAEAKDLPRLKDTYPYLFPEQYPDSIWLLKMQDSLQKELLEEVELAFSGFETTASDLELLMKHIVYYFPGIQVPTVITLTSDVDYNNRVVLADSILLLGLDNYLGKDHRFYAGIDRYIADDLEKQYIPSDVAASYANMLVKRPTGRSFLDRMIYHGKILYLKERWLSWIPDHILINYTEEEMDWAKSNEEQIWRYFIERELLYSTDQGLGPRFLDPAPFSKFRLELDNESPDRVGRFIGWNIVRAYMENNERNVRDLIEVPNEEIFKRSRYKPNK